MGYSNPLYTYAASPNVPLSDFVGAGSFWKGAAVAAVLLGCASPSSSPSSPICCGRAAPISGSRVRLGGCAATLRRLPLAIAGVAAVAMAATGAYAYHNIKDLNRYETSDEAEKFSADYERKYLKYEKLPQPGRSPR